MGKRRRGFLGAILLTALWAGPSFGQAEPGAQLPPPGDLADVSGDSDAAIAGDAQSDVPPSDVTPPIAEAEPQSVEFAAPKVLRVAVMDFERDGIDDGIARIVEQSVVLELRKLQRTDVIGMDEIRQIISYEEQKQALGCDTESCLAEIGDALGADIVIVGTLAKVGDSHVFGMRAINPMEVQLEGAVSQRLTPAGGEEFLAAVGPLVEELLPQQKLREGQDRGVPEEVALRLNPPPIPVWATMSVAGLSASALVGVGAFLATNVIGGLAYTGLVDTAKSSASATTYQTLLGLGWGTNVALIAAAASAAAFSVGAVATVTMAFFTDWTGVGDDVE